MSYNVDTWKTKALDGLQLPLAAFFEHERSDWHPDIARGADGEVTLCFIDSTILGVVENEVLRVTEIDIYGEGSGTFLNYTFEPALRKSRGRLVAARVWESGDSIDELTVENGVLSTRQIEL